MSRYGSRKFILALLTLGAATALRVLNYIDGAQWVNIAGAVMLFFGASNAASKFAPTSETTK